MIRTNIRYAVRRSSRVIPHIRSTELAYPLHHHCALCDMINLCFSHHEDLESLQETFDGRPSSIGFIGGFLEQAHPVHDAAHPDHPFHAGHLSCLGVYVDLPSSRITYPKGTGLVSLYGRSGTATIFHIQHGVNAKEAGIHLGVTGLDGDYPNFIL